MTSSHTHSKKTTTTTSGGSHNINETNFQHRTMSSTGTGGLLSGTPPTSPQKSELTDSQASLEKSQAAALKDREAQLDEREAELQKQLESLAKREDALDVAHEKLIGGGTKEDDDDATNEREAELDEREAQLKQQQDSLAKREDALDAAHERLIGGEPADNKDDDEAAGGKSSSTIEELRKENDRLRAELAATQKRSGRFLSQRAKGDDAAGHDRFRLSERKAPGAGLPMGFDPGLMEKWRSGHKMMSPRVPRAAAASSGADGK